MDSLADESDGNDPMLKFNPYFVKGVDTALGLTGLPFTVAKIVKIHQATRSKDMQPKKLLFIVTDTTNEKAAFAKLTLYATGMTPMRQKILFMIFDKYVSPKMETALPEAYAFIKENFKNPDIKA